MITAKPVLALAAAAALGLCSCTLPCQKTCRKAAEPVFESAAVSGALAVDASDYKASDVNFRPMFPLQNAKNTVAVKVRNTGSAPLAGVKVALRDDSGKLIGEKSVDIAAKSSSEVLFDWTPAENGYRKLTVSAVSGKDAVEVGAVAPVISRPLYFPWFGGHNEKGKALRYANIVLSGEQKLFDYWRGRGALPCLWKGVDTKMDASAYAADLAKGLGDYEKGPAGIMIDEMGGYEPEEILASNYFKGLKKFLKENPKCFTAVWLCGSLHLPYCNITRNVYRKDSGINLLMLECYNNYQVAEFASRTRFDYFDQRIFVARQQDVLMNTVMTLAIDGNQDKFNLLPYEIEDELRYIRSKAPDMPGVGWFHADTKSPELVAVADNLSRKYFIDPVLQVYAADLQFSKNTPRAGESFTVLAGVGNIGAMDARDVTVKVYADGKLLAVENVDLPALQTGKTPRTVQVKAPFTAKKSGYVKFRVELVPNHDETVLDGVAERTLYIY